MKSILLFLKTADRKCFFPGPPIISCLCTRTLPLTVILPYQMCMSILFSGNNLSIILYLSHESTCTSEFGDISLSHESQWEFGDMYIKYLKKYNVDFLKIEPFGIY